MIEHGEIDRVIEGWKPEARLLHLIMATTLDSKINFRLLTCHAILESSQAI